MSQYLCLRNITKIHLLISMLHFLKNLIESRIDAINNPIKKPLVDCFEYQKYFRNVNWILN